MAARVSSRQIIAGRSRLISVRMPQPVGRCHTKITEALARDGYRRVRRVFKQARP